MSEAQSNSGASFADRFKKKSSFSADNFRKSEIESSKSSSGSITDKIREETEKATNVKPIDPQKKMQAELIYLVKGVDAGRNAWYYVLVDRLKVQLFLKALNDEIIHLENYGKILHSAYGDEPPAEITNALKEEYGIS